MAECCAKQPRVFAADVAGNQEWQNSPHQWLREATQCVCSRCGCLQHSEADNCVTSWIVSVAIVVAIVVFVGVVVVVVVQQ